MGAPVFLSVLLFNFCIALGTIGVIYHMFEQGSESGDLAYDDYTTWDAVIRERGPEKAREEFLRITSVLAPSTQHLVGHAFGRALYERFGFEGLAYCGIEYTAGCIHEVTARDFLASDDPLVNADRCKKARNRAACEHAIGHGLMHIYGYSKNGLIRSLEACSELNTSQIIQGCTYGAFMEYYIRNVGGPRNDTPADDNALALCKELTGIARSSCFYNIPTIWYFEEVNSFDPEQPFRRIAERCIALADTGSDRHDCARGAGRTIGSFGTLTHERRVSLCSEVFKEAPMYTPSCEGMLAQFTSL